jgi:hypothetical protein|tara:strand:+ start:753 stop:926 length:174 start_codon:yes stop_codon:yes gene_type:complete
MRRRINCTLTDRQNTLLWSAIAYYELVLEDEINDGIEPPQAMAAFDRMCDRLKEIGR